MTIQWPVPPKHQATLRAHGFTMHGHHGRFAFAFAKRGPVAIVEYFVLHPRLRGGRYLRLAYLDVLDHLRQLGVRYVVAYAPKAAPIWRRLGMRETEPGWLLVRI
jgi:hypothetical protein